MSFEFARPFDGTQPEVNETEQRQVAALFSPYVDSVLRDKAPHKHTIDEGTRTRPNLVTFVELAGKVNQADISVRVSDSPNNARTLKRVRILEQDDRGRDGDAVIYNLGRDCVVRRRDVPLQTPAEKDMEWAAGLRPDLNSLLGNRLTPTEGLLISLNGLAALLKSAEGAKLERDMGLNDQPIGLDEWYAVEGLVSSCVVPERPKYG